MCASCNTDSSNRKQDACDNNYQTQDSSKKSDWEVTTKVKKALMTDGSLSSNARVISVTTNNGVVTLTGTVSSGDERRRVINIVQNVPGVADVNDQLTVP